MQSWKDAEKTQDEGMLSPFKVQDICNHTLFIIFSQ